MTTKGGVAGEDDGDEKIWWAVKRLNLQRSCPRLCVLPIGEYPSPKLIGNSLPDITRPYSAAS